MTSSTDNELTAADAAAEAALDTRMPGPIPLSREGWCRVRLGDVVRSCKEDVVPETSGLERYIAGEHMDSDDLHLRRWGVVGKGYLGPAFHRRFRNGQILFGSRRPYLRKVAVAEFEGVCANTTLVLESSSDKLLDTFLPFLLTSEHFYKFAVSQQRGSVNPYVNWSDLAAYEFYLPPPAQQRQIAEILWACEAAGRAYKTIVFDATQLRRRLLDEFFGKLGVAGALEGSRNELPDDWQLRRVHEVGRVQLGRQRSPQHTKNLYPRSYLRVANVFDDYIDISDVLTMDFDLRDFATYRLKKGDILLNEGQSKELVGRSAIFNDEVSDCCFQNTLVRFQSGEHVTPEFAQRYFQWAFYNGVFERISRQTTSIAHLGAERFSQLYFPVPPDEIQQSFCRQFTEAASVTIKAQECQSTLKIMRETLIRDFLK